MSDPLDDPELAGLVAEAMELRDEGVDPPLEVICASRPELLPAVREALEASIHIPRMHETGAMRDRFAGKILGERYKLQQRLGSGAMGVVYRAQDLELQRPVAVKILRSAFLDSQEAEQRFLREAEALASITDERIVQVFDRGRTADDDPFLVMELLEGCSLAEVLDRLQQDKVTVDQDAAAVVAEVLGLEELPGQTYLRTLVHWAAEIAGGLESAHIKGVFHRDVKPSNIFLTTDGRAKLIDFGIAAQEEQATLTREGAALGTPAYIAPEALTAGGRPGPGLDVYGLAASLYHMLALRPPFSGTPSQILRALAIRDVEPLGRVAAVGRWPVPRDLQAVVETGMSRKPEARYSSAAAMAADLRAFLDYMPVQARRQSPAMRWMRRAAASTRVRTAAVVCALFLGGLLMRSMYLDHQADRRVRLVEASKRLLPALTLQEARWRRKTDPELRQQIAANLDMAVESSDQPLPYLAYRAAFRWDQGDMQGAAADMEDLAAVLDTPLAQELATRYRDQAESGGAEPAIALPEGAQFTCAEDRFLLAYHLRRAGRNQEAADLLDHEELQFLPYALAVRLHCEPVEGFSLEGHLKRAQRLEQLTGYRTADSAHQIGFALAYLRRYRDAIPVIEEGVQLAPASTGLLGNLAYAAWRAGDFELAKDSYRRAIELRPNYLKSHRNYIGCLLDHFAPDEALTALEDAPFPETPGGAAERAGYQGEIEAVRALSALRERDKEGSRAAARRALDLFAVAVDGGAEEDRLRELLARGIVEGRTQHLFVPLIQKAIRSPWDRSLRKTLLQFRTEQLNAEIAEALLLLIQSDLEYRTMNETE